MLKEFILAFIPVFVAVDVIGLLPIFISLTRRLNKKQIKKTLILSFITGVSLALIFIFVGKWLFAMLGITVNDFMVAGGVILFLIALRDIFDIGKHAGEVAEMGAVPIGTPLIVGPGVLTTCLILTAQYGIIPTITSVVLNVLIAVLVLSFSGAIIKLIGNTGVLAVSRIMALLLAAIAVMMIRKGLMGMLL
ncbi:MAG: MarC family protein [Candidatus Goldbacteria bacterium]|nr:MarC family protein [Candidatus Goldiibacteriota bacterium]